MNKRQKKKRKKKIEAALQKIIDNIDVAEKLEELIEIMRYEI